MVQLPALQLSANLQATQQQQQQVDEDGQQPASYILKPPHPSPSAAEAPPTARTCQPPAPSGSTGV